MTVTRVTLVYCPRCSGVLFTDNQDNDLLACLHCARRYIAPESLLSRSPSKLEMSVSYRRSIAHHEARM